LMGRLSLPFPKGGKTISLRGRDPTESEGKITERGREKKGDRFLARKGGGRKRGGGLEADLGAYYSKNRKGSSLPREGGAQHRDGGMSSGFL